MPICALSPRSISPLAMKILSNLFFLIFHFSTYGVSNPTSYCSFYLKATTFVVLSSIIRKMQASGQSAVHILNWLALVCHQLFLRVTSLPILLQQNSYCGWFFHLNKAFMSVSVLSVLKKTLTYEVWILFMFLLTLHYWVCFILYGSYFSQLFDTKVVLHCK